MLLDVTQDSVHGLPRTVRVQRSVVVHDVMLGDFDLALFKFGTCLRIGDVLVSPAAGCVDAVVEPGQAIHFALAARRSCVVLAAVRAWMLFGSGSVLAGDRADDERHQKEQPYRNGSDGDAA